MEQIIGPIGIRTMFFEKAGDVCQGHTHNFDHVTMVLTGGVRVRYSKEIDGKLVVQGERDFYAPKQVAGEGVHAFVLILKNIHHEITALEPYTHCWCVFAHRDFHTGEVVQDWNGWMKAMQ